MLMLLTEDGVATVLQASKRLLQSFICNAMDADSLAIRLSSFFDVLNQTGLVDDQVILGEEFFTMPYPPREGGHDSGLCYQAAIHIPRGIGVLLMDTESRYQLSKIPDGIEAHSAVSFIPIHQTKPVIQQWLLPQFDGLVRKLLALINLRMTSSRTALPMVPCNSCSVQIEVRS